MPVMITSSACGSAARPAISTRPGRNVRRGGASIRTAGRYRPPDPIYAITPSQAVARHLSIQYAVFPILAPDVASTGEMLTLSDALLCDRGLLRNGDSVVFV